MQGSGGGPLGALLILAPLAAIPVFAIIGVPQFAPVAASPADEEIVEPVQELRPAVVAASPASIPRRTADDLFAPLPQSSAAAALAKPKTTSEVPMTSRPSAARTWTPPPEALGDWQISQDDGNHPSPLAAPTEFDNHRARLESEHPASAGLAAASRNLAGTSNRSALAAPVRQVAAVDAASARSRSHGLVPVDDFDGGLLEPQLEQAHANPLSAGNHDLQSPPRGGRPATIPQANAATMDRMRAELSPLASSRSDWQAAARRLKDLGITQYRLEARIEEQRFIFRCVFPMGESTEMKRVFEADADDPLDAVLQVLEQVDEWRADLVGTERDRSHTR